MILPLILSSCFAAEVTVGSGLDTTAGIVADFTAGATTAVVGPEILAALTVAAGSVLSTATTIAQWEKAETKRRYREAAEEGRERLARGEDKPISNSPPESSLRLVAEIERATFPDQLRRSTEADLVRLIIAHAQRLNDPYAAD